MKQDDEMLQGYRMTATSTSIINTFTSNGSTTVTLHVYKLIIRVYMSLSALPLEPFGNLEKGRGKGGRKEGEEEGDDEEDEEGKGGKEEQRTEDEMKENTQVYRELE